jgi:Ca-activated chloride channel family protein
MVNLWGENMTRMQAERKVLNDNIDSLKNKPNVEMGLRVFGDQSPVKLNDCSDTRLVVPFGPNNAQQMKDAVNRLEPLGITPITLSLEKATGDFTPEANVRNVIILITDGEESCGRDPCELSLALQKAGIVLRPFIIALGLNDNLISKLECMGSFFNAQDPAGFRQAMDIVLQKALTPVFVQVNLLDQQGRPVESDVDMTFYDAYTNNPRYNYIHTINYKGVSDTLVLDPIPTYDLVIQTVPPVERGNIKLVQGKNNIINIPTPQGYLLLKLQSNTIDNNIHNKIKCLVRLQTEYPTVAVQDINEKEKYLTGKYQLEFLTLPRTVINNVDISQSETTTIQILTPGILTVQKSAPGFGAIFTIDGTMLDKIYSLNENGGSEVVALQPGTYKVVFRPKYARHTTDTVEKTFTISSGGTTSVNF